MGIEGKERTGNALELSGYRFQFLQELEPQRDSAGSFVIERPQDDSEHRKTKQFNRYGDQDFCKLTIRPNMPEGSFVYVMYDGKKVLYIGESENLQNRFGPGNYQSITAHNCFVGGQVTNCKVNANILKHYRAGKKVSLYCLETKDKKERKLIERELIFTEVPEERPLWNWDTAASGKTDSAKKKIDDSKIKITRFLDNTPSAAFNYGNANEYQKRAIATTDGPVLITAGPGTGKTFTLVQRALYLIQEKGVKPEEILMATFTEKAAKELITRISNELLKRNILVNLNEMYIGTFHSICLRIIKENLEYSHIKKNYRTLDDFDQKYTVMRHINEFRRIENFSLAIPDNIGVWEQADTICRYVNNLSEELVESEELKADGRPHIVALGEIMEKYNALLDIENLMDFSKLQTEAFSLLQDNPSVLEKVQGKIKYLMIDEYQDTNYIQERLVFLLGQHTGNICVVGDDDQGLYRFRGATIRNILEFPGRFEDGLCIRIPLVINYRSNSDIVSFYNDWMNPSEFDWDMYRYDKTIEPHNGNVGGCPGVLRLAGEGSIEKWHENVLAFIQKMQECGKVEDYNQIAFLFRSVKSAKAKGLAEYLEANGVSVYSPRADLFFNRDEVKLVIGLFLFLFPQYVGKMEARQFKFMDPELEVYYRGCIEFVNDKIVADKQKYRDLLSWIKGAGIKHQALGEALDYSYAGLLYRMFEYEPFRNFLDVNISFTGVKDLRLTRNLSILSQIITKYEYLHHINVLTPNNIEEGTERFFNLFLRFLYKGGINEYEDETVYAPPGCVSFLTIHQSKGMEFPVVVVGSLSSTAKNNADDIIGEIEESYFQRKPFEPEGLIRLFDFWRLFYTAFSRAQNLLVLTSPETRADPNKYFKKRFYELHSVLDNEIDLSKLTLEKVKDVNLKDSFAFTSDISVYETCAVQYKFMNVLDFSPVLVGATLYGRLVHETIEDIHRAALRGETHLINEPHITSWFDTNYDSLSKAEHSYLAVPQLKAARDSILRYAELHRDKWENIVEAEVGVSLVNPDYIIAGKIDLIRSNTGDDAVEIVDFKSEKKPKINETDSVESARIERYKKQLQVYAWLVEQNTGKKVSKMHLYYTGEENGVPTITFEPSRLEIQSTIADFDKTVRKIQAKNFSHKSASGRICENCDFRFYCKR
jgi:DNA helicase-2/ATP-dependent DNA helicase PcrA